MSNTPVAIVTGASRGLGTTLAGFLAGKGYNLVLTSRGRDSLENAAASLKPFGVQVRAIAGDVTDADHRNGLVAAAQELGSLDLLINNASDLGTSPPPPLKDYPLDALTQVLAVNVVAQVGLTQAALPRLRENNGLIINISSDAAKGGYPGWGGYGASKAALDLISLTLANELRDEGISIVSVDPGDMRTSMQQAAYPGEDISDRPLPEVTLPFWGWLLGQDRLAISGQRFEAQAEHWEVQHEPT